MNHQSLLHQRLILPLFTLLAGWLCIAPARAQFTYVGQIDTADVGLSFTNPFSVAADAKGNVYITDGNGSLDYIHKYDGTKWTILRSGIPGNGDFKMPRGITVDGKGNLYVADSQNSRIQKFDGKTWTSFGTSGSGSDELMHPEDVIVDDKSGDVYIADLGNFRVQKYSQATKTWTSLVSPTMRDKGRPPYAVALDSEGNLYVNIDLGSGALPDLGRIEKFDGKTWTTYASNAGALGPFWGLGDIAFDEADNLYIADVFNTRVLKFDGTHWTAFGSSGRGNGEFNSSVYAVAFGPAGRVYVSDWGNRRVQIFNQAVPAVMALREGSDKLTSGGSYDFGQVAGGDKRTVTFTIHNRGGAPLTLDSTASVTGTHAGDFTADFSETAAALAPKGTTTFKVTFKPAAAGAHRAQLAIASNDPATPVFRLNLAGSQAKADQPVVSVPGDSIPVVSVPVDSVSVDSVSVDSVSVVSVPVVSVPVEGKPSGDKSFAGTGNAGQEVTLNVFPNPARGELRVTVPANLREAPLVLYSFAGNALLTQPGGGDNLRKLDVKNLPAGVYYLRVGSGPEQLTQRVMISN